MVRCVLHIGMEKTGTTMLQGWLYSNRAEFLANGVCPAGELARHPRTPQTLALMFEEDLGEWYSRSRGLIDSQQFQKHFRPLKQALAIELADVSARVPVTVLSSEHCFRDLRTEASIGALKSFLNRWFDCIDVYVYLRAPRSMIQAAHSQALRQGCTLRLRDFAVRWQRLNPSFYSNGLQRWTNVFGAEHVHFRNYERDNLKGRDICVDFGSWALPAVPISELSFGEDPASTNPSVTGFAAEGFRQINQLIPYWVPTPGRISILNRRLKEALEQRWQAGVLPQTMPDESVDTNLLEQDFSKVIGVNNDSLAVAYGDNKVGQANATKTTSEVSASMSAHEQASSVAEMVRQEVMGLLARFNQQAFIEQLPVYEQKLLSSALARHE